MSRPSETNGAEWLQPPPEEQGLKRYVETIRERIWWVLLAVLITTTAAAVYVATAQKKYEAESQLLITPVPATDTVLTSLGLLVESSDPTRDVETATRLVKTPQVSALVKQQLGSSKSTKTLLSQVSSDPVAQSNLVAITATADSPEEARDVANAFAQGTVQERTDAFQTEVNARLQQLQGRGSVGPAATDIGELQVLQGAPNPNFRVQTLAETPTSASSPRPVLSIAAGIFAGLILGIGGAFLSQTLDPTLRREAQLRRLYRLPILTRIPRQPGRRKRRQPLSPRALSAAAGEAYRTLRATIARDSRGRRARVVLVTGPSASEGKSTTALNLASSIALTGRKVILIEADLRRPSLGRAMEVEPGPGRGVISVLIENTKLEDALISNRTYGPNLQVLLADRVESGWVTDLFSIPSAHQMIEDARKLADYVVIDSPPLNEVVDALPLARQSDEVLMVVRLGTTRLDKLSQLAELLAESGITPIGFAVVGTAKPPRGGYHYIEARGNGAGSTDGQRPLYRAPVETS
jgi:capsular exopolysaccharide synthesis family protein